MYIYRKSIVELYVESANNSNYEQDRNILLEVTLVILWPLRRKKE